MKKILLFAFVFISILNLNAQSQCGTDEYDSYLKRTNPTYAVERQKMEQDIYTILKNKQNNPNARIAQNDCQLGGVFTIPIVVHVMHIGESVGTGINISDAQIQGAIQNLNETWRRLTGDGVDFEIQFTLAVRDPNGNTTTGINRVNASSIPRYISQGIHLGDTLGANDKLIKDLSRWPKNKYVNIWVCKLTGACGYANYPSYIYEYQGIVMNYNCMTYSSNTLGHEMGHYFNLKHTFYGDGAPDTSPSTQCPDNNDCLLEGDNVCDTPPHRKEDCSITSCTTSGTLDNSFKNYMSYCGTRTRFTNGQKERVHTALYEGYRWSLVTSDGLIPATITQETAIDSIANGITENICANFTPKVRIKNLGTNVLSNCKIQTYIDDVLQNTTSITAINLPKDSSRIVSLLPVLSVYNTHSFRFVLSQINGSDTDFFVLNNSICGDINLIRNNYNLYLVANNGTTTGSGTYACNSIANINAIPNSCYQFINWTENGNILSTNPSDSITITSERQIIANFERIVYTINLTPMAGSTASGSSDVYCGSTYTARAILNSCYTFKNWTENGTIVSTNANYTFTVSVNRNLVANFDKKRYTIAVSPDNIANGSVSGNGIYGCDTFTTVTATPASCYTFTKWTENGNTISTSSSYSFYVSVNRSLIANFTKKRFSITLSPNDASKGTVTGNGSYGCDTTVTVKAKIKTGAVWQNWTENGNVVSTDSIYSFSASANRTLVANFTAATYTIAIASNIANAGTLTGGGTISYGTSTSVVSTPASCYSFKNWSENGTIVSTNANYIFTVSANRNLVANFEPKRYNVALVANPTNGGTLSGAGNFACDSSLTVKAKIKTGYQFINWTDGSTIVSTDSNYTFLISGARSLKANFSLLTGIKQTTINEISKIYPNPANEILQIEIRSKQNTLLTLNIIDMKGSLLETKTINNTKGTFNTSFDVSKLAKGNYLLNLYDEDGMASYKFVVQ